MNHTETISSDENELNVIRKKLSLVRDGSNRIFDITKKLKQDSDDDDDDDDNWNNNGNLDQGIDEKTDVTNIESQKQSMKKTNENGLKEILCLRKKSCQFSLPTDIRSSPISLHTINESSQSVICHDGVSENEECVKQGGLAKTVVSNGTTVDSNRYVRPDKFQPSPRKKQTFMNMHPEIQASFHRRRKRFLVACGTVLLAVSVIITIIVYVVIMTVRYLTQMNRLAFHHHSRL